MKKFYAAPFLLAVMGSCGPQASCAPTPAPAPVQTPAPVEEEQIIPEKVEKSELIPEQSTEENPTATRAIPSGTYRESYFAAPTQQRSWTVRINSSGHPDGYFWSNQINLTGGNGGYLGLQENACCALTGRIALMSIWGAVDGRSPGIAQPFEEDGVGYSVAIPYAWVEGQTYTLKLEMITEQNSVWLRGTVNGQLVGDLKMAPGVTSLGTWQVQWTENFWGDRSSCDVMGYANSTWGPVSGATSYRPYVSDGTCASAIIYESSDGSVVRMEMGL